MSIEVRLTKLRKRANMLSEEIEALEYPIEQRKKGASQKEMHLTFEYEDVLAEIEVLEKTLQKPCKDT